MTNMDKLYEAVAARGPVCVGLDTDFSYLPEGFAKAELTAGENIVRFNQAIVDATKSVAGCFKVQIDETRQQSAAGRVDHLFPVGGHILHQARDLAVPDQHIHLGPVRQFCVFDEH